MRNFVEIDNNLFDDLVIILIANTHTHKKNLL